MSIDSKFYHFMTKVADCMILSVLWITFSIPVITAGAASSALYYCALKVLRKEEGSTIKSFWKAFRSSFKQSTIVTAGILLFALAVTAVGSAVYAIFPGALSNIYFMYLVLLVFGISWLHYVFSYIARFENRLGVILKNSLVICLVNFPQSVMIMLLFVAVVAGIALLMPNSFGTLLFAPAVYALISSYPLEKIYRKYIPDETV